MGNNLPALHPVERANDLAERARVLRWHLILVELDSAFINPIRVDLRVLVKNGKESGNEGLVLEVGKLFGRIPQVTFSVLEGLPDTNPSSRSRTVNFADFLEEKMTHRSTPWTYKEFIWKTASQLGAHSDPRPHTVSRDSGMRLGGVDPLILQLMALARTISSVTDSLVEDIQEGACPCGSGKKYKKCHGA